MNIGQSNPLKREMRVISVYNKKGGTCKTTCVMNIAASLAAMGFRVGLVDGDEQANASSLTRPHKYANPTLTHVICDRVPLINAMYQARKNLWIVPSDMNLSRAVEHINAQQDFDLFGDRVDELREILAPAQDPCIFPWWEKSEVQLRQFKLEETSEEEFNSRPIALDFLLFDNPPNPNALTTALLFACREVIIPIEMEEFSFQGLVQMSEDLKRRFRKRQEKVKVSAIVPFNVSHQGGSHMDYLASVWRVYPNLTQRSVHHDKTVSTAQGYKLSSLEYDKSSRATKEMFALALSVAGYQGSLAHLSTCNLCAETIEQAKQANPQQGSSEE